MTTGRLSVTGRAGITTMSKTSTGYYIREGFFSIFSHGLMSTAAVGMILACLLIMGSFSLVAVNIDHMLGNLERDNEFLAYVDETLDEAQARALETSIQKVTNVASAEFVAREEAMENFVAGKDNALFRDLPNEVFRHRYRVHVVNIEFMEQTVLAVEALPGVAGYSAAVEIARGFVMVRNVASAVSLILIAFLLVIALFIIANTIRLATFHRRDEIAIMKMCGATNWFVRWPFIIEGIILGLMGATLAFFSQWGVYALLIRAISVSSAGLNLIDILPFKDMALKVLGIFSGVGVLIGAGGSLLAIRRFLQV